MTGDALLTAAVLGTDRRAPPADAFPPLAPPLAAHTPEWRLLLAAGAAALHAQAGRVPSPAPPPPPAAAPDPRPVCAPDAAALLAALTRAREHALVAEWLAAAQAAAVRPPAALAPALLDLARRHPALQPAALRAVGPLGPWLAARHPAFAFAAPPPPPAPADLATFTAAPLPERLATLDALRRAGPTRADEPLLEAALDDRRKEVRQAAADLLATLPGSALSARMAARVAVCFAVHHEGLHYLEVTLPDALDDAARRDGLTERSPETDVFGPRAGWLAQMLALAPPSALTRALRCPPERFVSDLLATDHAALAQPLARAALRHRDRPFAAALLRGALDGAQDWDKVALTRPTVAALTRLIGPAKGDALVLELLTRNLGPLDDIPAAWPLVDLPGPWSPALTHLFRARLRRDLHSPRAFAAAEHALDLARHVPIDALDPADLTSPDPDAAADLAQARDLLARRRAVAQALRGGPR